MTGPSYVASTGVLVNDFMQRRSTQELSGWLISPEGNWCYCFQRDPKSWQRYPFVYVDKWSAKSDGTPSQMKHRRKLPLDDALALCGQMLLEGWQKLSKEFDLDSEDKFSKEVVV